MSRVLILVVCLCGTLSLFALGCEDAGEAELEQTTSPENRPDPNTPEGQTRILIDQLNQQLMEGKMAEADATVKQLNQLRPKVPPEVQQEIEGVINAYQVNKATAPPPGGGN